MLSVIIPINNGKDFMTKCIESVLLSVRTLEAEIILVDDASDDGTDEICKKYQREYPDLIQYIRLEKMAGPSIARNHALDMIKGDFVTFIDSDDYIEPAMFPDLLNYQKKGNYDIVCCGYLLENRNKTTRIAMNESKDFTGVEGLRELLANDIIGNYLWNKIYRTSLFKGIRFPEGEIFEDIQVMYKLMIQSKKIYVTKNCYYHYVKRNGSLTYKPSEKDLLLQHAVVSRVNNDIIHLCPELEKDANSNTLRKNILIYSRLAKGNQWKKCKVKCADIRSEIRMNKHLFKNIPLKYRILGYLIVYMPWFHGFIMSGR